MAQVFTVHPTHPQPRLVRQAAGVVRDGGLIVYPTDSCFALGCHLDDAEAVRRLRAVRGMDDTHFLTLLCRDLSEIAQYARVDNQQYRWLKSATPGPYTFILAATREVPRRVQHPKRNTIGIRVPEHAVAQALLAELDTPLLSASLVLPGDEAPLSDAAEIHDRIGKQVDLIVDSGAGGVGVTTVIDLTSGEPRVVRRGQGDLSRFGLDDAS